MESMNSFEIRCITEGLQIHKFFKCSPFPNFHFCQDFFHFCENFTKCRYLTHIQTPSHFLWEHFLYGNQRVRVNDVLKFGYACPCCFLSEWLKVVCFILIFHNIFTFNYHISPSSIFTEKRQKHNNTQHQLTKIINRITGS